MIRDAAVQLLQELDVPDKYTPRLALPRKANLTSMYVAHVYVYVYACVKASVCALACVCAYSMGSVDVVHVST